MSTTVMVTVNRAEARRLMDSLSRQLVGNDDDFQEFVLAAEVEPNNLKIVDTKTVGKWPGDDLRRAFVMGAKWWEFRKSGATMWPSDQDVAEAEAESRYPNGRPKI